MAMVHKDFRGMKCPLPVLKLNLAVVKHEVNAGDVVEIIADCPTFEQDLRTWCATMKKVLVKCYVDGPNKVAQIQI